MVVEQEIRLDFAKRPGHLWGVVEIAGLDIRLTQAICWSHASLVRRGTGPERHAEALRLGARGYCQRQQKQEED